MKIEISEKLIMRMVDVSCLKIVRLEVQGSRRLVIEEGYKLSHGDRDLYPNL